MSSSIVSSLNLAKAAFATFLAGKALHGIAGMLGGTSESGQGLLEDYLRAAGFEPKQLTEHMLKLRNKIPGLPRTEYMGGAYDIASVLSEGGPEMVKKGMESMSYLWKSLGPEASRQEAANLIRGVVGAWGIGKAPGEVLKIIEQFEATIPPILNRTGIKGHELALALSQVISIYKEKGLTLADMVAETAAIGGVMKERTGEVLRNIQSRLVEGTAELATRVGLELELRKRGVTRIEQLSQGEAAIVQDSIKATEDHQQRKIALLEKMKGPKGVALYLKDILEIGKQLEAERGFPLQKYMKSAFGETAPQGLPLWIEAHTSGKIDQLKAQKESVEKQRADRERAWQSYEARYTILQQQVENLKQSTLSGFKAALADIYGGYGKILESITAEWSKNTEIVAANMRLMISAFGEGFKSVFGGNIPDIIKNISDAMLGLVKMPTEELQAKAYDLGSSLASMFKQVHETIVPLNSDFGSLLTSVKDLVDGINLLLAPLRWLADLAGKIGAAHGTIFNDAKTQSQLTQQQLEFHRSYNKRNAERAAEAAAAAEAEQFRPGTEFWSGNVAPPEKDKSWWDKVRDLIVGPTSQTEGESIKPMSYEVPESNFQIACTVNIDGASLDGIVDARIDKIMQDHRMGYGEYGFARPFTG